jgi:hypothetical protein
VTDEYNDDTPPTHTGNGEHQHSGPYRGADPAQQDLYRRMERLEARDETREMDVASLTASRRFWKWTAGLGIPALLSAAFVLLLYSADKVSASAEHVGETRAEIRALSKLIDLLTAEVAELRRHAGLDSKPISISLGGT